MGGQGFCKCEGFQSSVPLSAVKTTGTPSLSASIKGRVLQERPGSAQWCPAVGQADMETDAQEVPPEHEEQFLPCVGN